MHGNGSLTCTGQYGRLSITLRTGAKQYLGGKLVCQNAHASPDEFFERSLALQSLHREKKRPGQCLKGLSSCNGLDSLIVLSMMCFSYIAIYTSCLWMYASISCSYAISCFHAYIKQKLYEYKLCMYRSINTARWW